DKNRDNAGLTAEILPRAVHDRIAERDIRNAERRMVVYQIILTGKFAHTVGTSRPLRMLRGSMKLLLVAVDRTARIREDNLLHAGRPARFEQIQKTQDVHFGVEHGVGDRASDVHLRRMM